MELSTMRLSTSDITGKKKGSASNDIFEKCRNFTRPSDLQHAGLYMYFEVFGDREGCGAGEVRIGKRKVLMFGSNDYLDLITHPKVKEAAIQAIRKYGSGYSGSRLLNGTLDIHVKLEAELAAFVHKEAAIIFGTGFQANYGTLSALTEKGDVMICDHNLHASLVEGALRSAARTVRFRHNDLDHFERCLENCPPEEKIFIVSEGVFSMEGDIADLRGMLKLAKPYGARTYVDEAHGIGVLGPTGAGAAEHLGVLDEIDIIMGTFSKSLASVGGFIAAERAVVDYLKHTAFGGFIAAERAVVDYLKHTARPFVFSASLPPGSVTAVGAALQIMKKEPERRLHLLRIAQLLRDELRSHGFKVLPGETAIVRVVIQQELDLCRLCKRLLEEGIYINPVLRPAAAQNLLRISCTAAHTERHVDRLITTLVKVAAELDIER